MRQIMYANLCSEQMFITFANKTVRYVSPSQINPKNQPPPGCVWF